MRVLMIAPPGAGNGIQGALIAAHFDIPHIAAGELLRDHVAQRCARSWAIVSDLAGVGYVVRQKDGRRIRYQIQAHLPLSEAGTGGLAIGDSLTLLAGTLPASPDSPAEGPLTPGARRQLRPRSFAGTRDKQKSDPPARSIIQRREGRMTLRWPAQPGLRHPGIAGEAD